MKPQPPGTPSKLSDSAHPQFRLDAVAASAARIRWRKELSSVVLAALVFMISLTFVPGSWAASRFKVLYAFKGTPDGASPSGDLTFDAAGNLYGATYVGGSSQSDCGVYNITGCGTVFKLAPGAGGWIETVLYRFCTDTNCSDGANPNGGMILDAAGTLYGTTIAGGGGNQFCSFEAGLGCGTAFELKPGQDGTWTETVLDHFQMNSPGGAGPNGGLIFDKSGNLYGTTDAGGKCCGPIQDYGAGLIYELTSNSGGWSENVLYSFCSQTNCSDGNSPFAGLIWGTDRTLYGTTISGGWDFFPCFGCGTVFELVESGGKWKEKVIHAFTGGDGVEPTAGLAADSQGNLYGTTTLDGPFGFGTVFKLTRLAGGRWNYCLLYSFRTGSFYGSFATRPVLDKAGNLYGTILNGGNGNCGQACGLVYKLTPGPHGKWKFTTVHNFTGGADGGLPSTDLILDDKGNLYGAAEVGGAAGYGTVFEITP